MIYTNSEGYASEYGEYNSYDGFDDDRVLKEFFYERHRKQDEEQKQQGVSLTELLQGRCEKASYEMVGCDELFSPAGIDEEHVSRLVQSIKSLGRLLYPLLVRPCTEAEKKIAEQAFKRKVKYTVLDGTRRLEALRRLGVKKAPVVVITIGNDDEMRVKVASNHVRQCNTWQMASIIKRLREEGLTYKAIAEKLSEMGCSYSEDSVRNMYKLNFLIWELREMHYLGWLNVKQIIWLARHPSERQKELARQFEELLLEFCSETGQLLSVSEAEQKFGRKAVKEVRRAMTNKILDAMSRRKKAVNIPGVTLQRIYDDLTDVTQELSKLSRELSKLSIEHSDLKRVLNRIESVKYAILYSESDRRQVFG